MLSVPSSDSAYFAGFWWLVIIDWLVLGTCLICFG